MLLGLPRAVVGPFAGFAAFGLLWGAWAALIPLVQRDVGASKGALGVALLCVGIGSLPAMLLVAPAVNRRGPQVMPLALLALAGAAILPALAGSVPTLGLALVAVGGAAGLVDVTINAAASEVEVRTGARIMQLAHALFSVGVLIGAIASGIARQAGAGRLEILGGAAVVLVGAAFVSRGQPGATRSGGGTSRVRFKRTFVLLGLVCGAAFLVESGIENWSALFLERSFDATPVVSSLGPAAYALAMVLGRLSGQWLTGRVTDRLLIVGGGACSVVGLLFAAAAPGIPFALVAFFVAGAGVSIVAPVMFSAAGRTAAEEERGSAVATVTTLGYMGFLAGPPLIGGTAQLVGLRASFVVLVGFAAALSASARYLPVDAPMPRSGPGEHAASEAV